VPKKFLKIFMEKSGFQLYLLPLPRSLFCKRVIHGLETDRTSHFPIRHWKNVSIELEYITAAGGRGSGQDTRGTWWFPRIIFLVYIGTRGAGTPDFTTTPEKENTILLTCSGTSRARLSCERIFLLIDKSQ